MNKLQYKITDNEIKEALLRSGYLLESRTEEVLRKNGYYVEANSAYADPESGKSREIDLYAMSARKGGPLEFDFIFSILLIECINNPQPLAFITKEPLVGFLHHYEVKLSGLPVKISNKPKNSWVQLSDFLHMENYHQYCKGRISTQFCSFVKKKEIKQWMAIHEGPHYDSFRKLCDAVEYHIDKHFKSWKFRENEPINIEFYYPVILLQGQLIDVQAKNDELLIIDSDYIQFRRSVIADSEQEDYQISVVTEKYFPEYLNIINKEMNRTASLMKRKHNTIRQSINKIVTKVSRLRSPEKIRKAMDF